MEKKEVSGELIQTFQGGVSSEKATQGKMILIGGLAVMEAIGIYFVDEGTNNYVDFVVILGLFAMIFAVILGVKVGIPFFKFPSEAKKIRIEIRSDGVIVGNTAGEVLFSCPYEMMGEPTVQKQSLFYKCQVPNKYGVVGFWYVETVEKGWEICEVIRSAALQAGIKL